MLEQIYKLSGRQWKTWMLHYITINDASLFWYSTENLHIRARTHTWHDNTHRMQTTSGITVRVIQPTNNGRTQEFVCIRFTNVWKTAPVIRFSHAGISFTWCIAICQWQACMHIKLIGLSRMKKQQFNSLQCCYWMVYINIRRIDLHVYRSTAERSPIDVSSIALL